MSRTWVRSSIPALEPQNPWHRDRSAAHCAASTTSSTRLVVPEPKPRRPSRPANRRYWTSRSQVGHLGLLTPGQIQRGRELGVGVDGLQSGVDVLPRDAFGPELAFQGGSRQVASPLTGFDPVDGERRVVDQANLGQPIQHVPDGLRPARSWPEEPGRAHVESVLGRSTCATRWSGRRHGGRLRDPPRPARGSRSGLRPVILAPPLGGGRGCPVPTATWRRPADGRCSMG